MRESAFGIDFLPQKEETAQIAIGPLGGQKTECNAFRDRTWKCQVDHLQHAIHTGTWRPFSLAAEVVAQLKKKCSAKEINKMRSVVAMWENDGDGLLREVGQTHPDKAVYIPNHDLKDALEDIRDNGFKRDSHGFGDQKYAFIGEKYVMKVLHSRNGRPVNKPCPLTMFEELFKDYVLARVSAGKTNQTEFRFVFPRLLQSDACEFTNEGKVINQKWIIVLEPKLRDPAQPFGRDGYPEELSLISGGWFRASHLEHEEQIGETRGVRRIVDALPDIIIESPALYGLRWLDEKGIPVPLCWRSLRGPFNGKFYVDGTTNVALLELVRWVAVFPELQKGAVGLTRLTNIVELSCIVLVGSLITLETQDRTVLLLVITLLVIRACRSFIKY